jgi:hypothetical protein
MLYFYRPKCLASILDHTNSPQKFVMKIFSLLLMSLVTSFQLGAQCLSFSNCEDSLQLCDLSTNNADLWNQPYWLDQQTGLHDLSDNQIDFSISATDSCGNGWDQIYYILYLDLDGDGQTTESWVSSETPPSPGTVTYFNPNFVGGTERIFDGRPVPPDQKYQFALDTMHLGNRVTAFVRWNTTANPDVFVNPEIPPGRHKIKWFFVSGTSQITCETFFEIKDCKKPTVVCLNGLAVNIMPTELVQLWASDFLQYSEDNATPTNRLQYGVRRSNTGTGFPLDGNGLPIQSVTFNCDELGTQFIELWVRDLAGNEDYCETYVIVQDPLGNCNSTAINLVVCVKRACDASVVSNTVVNITTSSTSTPPVSYFALMDTPNGCWDAESYIFNLPVSTVSVTPNKDDYQTNGVTTFDLVKIQRHILAVEPLSTYEIIAADANKSNSVTLYDVLELRNLILGIYSELPNNTSWRFLSSDNVFPNPSNPFQGTLVEEAVYENVVFDSTYRANFVAIKIGDVNCSANPGAAAPSEDRRSTVLTFPDAVMASGERIALPLTFSEAGDWLAMEAGLMYDPQQLVIEAIVPGLLPDLEKNSFAEPTPGVLNMAWYTAQPQAVAAGDPLYTLHLRALQPLQLSESLKWSDHRSNAPHQLSAVGYDGQETRIALALAFRGQEVPEMSDQTIVFPVQPNPTSGIAYIAVQLAQAETVRLTITDLEGKKILEQEQAFSEGAQILEIPADITSKPGVYFWKVQAGATVESGKLIRMIH